MKEYLVILAGSPRGGEATWNSLYKNVIKTLNADLAICTTSNFVNESSLFKNSNYQWIIKNYQDFFDYYRTNFKGNWKEFFELGMNTGLYSSGSIHFIFKDFILKNYLNILKGYKYIIYSRFDQYYMYPHIKGNPNKILIPSGEDYKGLCDRHVIFPSEYSELILDICKFIDSSDIDKLKGEFLNCEVTYQKQLDKNNCLNLVERYARTQFTTSLPGEPTNWRIAKYKIYFFNKLLLKYPDEFLDSVFNVTKELGVIKTFSRNPVLVLNYKFLKIKDILGKFKYKLTYDFN